MYSLFDFLIRVSRRRLWTTFFIKLDWADFTAKKEVEVKQSPLKEKWARPTFFESLTLTDRPTHVVALSMTFAQNWVNKIVSCQWGSRSFVRHQSASQFIFWNERLLDKSISFSAIAAQFQRKWKKNKAHVATMRKGNNKITLLVQLSWTTTATTCFPYVVGVYRSVGRSRARSANHTAKAQPTI